MSGPTGSDNGNDGTTPMNDTNGSTPGGSKPLRAVGNQPAIAGAGAAAPRPMGRPGGGPGFMGGMNLPAPKPKSFKASFRRLLGELRPEGPKILVVLVLAVGSVLFAILGPKILGEATNVIFAGVVGKGIPAGATVQEAVNALNAAGQTTQAQLLASVKGVVPGQGIDFTLLAQILSLAAVLYIVSSVFAWGQSYIMAGVTQRTVYRLRRRVDEKLGRLPLAYFDGQSRGDILSRVTNDIDNISQTLQQSLTQLITSVLTVIGVLIMMLTISPLLAVISLITVPLSIAVTVLIAGRSQKQFVAAVGPDRVAQRPHRGDAHRALDRQGVRPPAGGHRGLRRAERGAVPGELPGPVHLRPDPARADVHLEHQLRADLRHRRHPGGQRLR